MFNDRWLGAAAVIWGCVIYVEAKFVTTRSAAVGGAIALMLGA